MENTLWMCIRKFIVLDLRKDMGNTLHLISAEDPKVKWGIEANNASSRLFLANACPNIVWMTSLWTCLPGKGVYLLIYKFIFNSWVLSSCRDIVLCVPSYHLAKFLYANISRIFSILELILIFKYSSEMKF